MQTLQGLSSPLRDNIFFGITTIIAEGLRIVYNNEATSKKPASKKLSLMLRFS